MTSQPPLWIKKKEKKKQYVQEREATALSCSEKTLYEDQEEEAGARCKQWRLLLKRLACALRAVVAVMSELDDSGSMFALYHCRITFHF